MIQQQPQPGQPFPASPPPQGNAQPPVTIDAVVKLLRDDRMRGFRIDIETDSLVESDQKQERADATELVTAVGGFFKEFGPIVQAMPPLAPLASGLLQFALRRYKVGAELEELVEKTMGDVQQHLANPTPPPPDPVEQAKLEREKIRAQAEGQKAGAEVQASQTKAKSETDKAQLEAYHAKIKNESDVQIGREKAALEKEAMLLDAEMKARADQRAHELHTLQLQHEREAHARKLEQGDQQHGQAMQRADMDARNAAEGHKQKIEQTRTQGEAKEKASKAKTEKPAKAEPKGEANPVKDVVAILETLGKSNKAKKVIRDDSGKITGIE